MNRKTKTCRSFRRFVVSTLEDGTATDAAKTIHFSVPIETRRLSLLLLLNYVYSNAIANGSRKERGGSGGDDMEGRWFS